MTKTISATASIKGYKESKIAKSEHNDCSVRTIANAFNVDYDKAHKFLTENYQRPNKRGVSTHNWHRVNDKFSDENTTVFGKKIKKVEYAEIEVDAKQCERRTTYWNEGSSYDYKKKLKLYTKKGSKYSQMTVGSFLKKHKEGTYILSVRAHTFTIKDGVVYGNGCDGVKMRVRLNKVWEIV
jgi:hypothetical protein